MCLDSFSDSLFVSFLGKYFVLVNTVHCCNWWNDSPALFGYYFWPPRVQEHFGQWQNSSRWQANYDKENPTKNVNKARSYVETFFMRKRSFQCLKRGNKRTISDTAKLTEQMAAGDALLSQRGLHCRNGGGENVGLLEHLRGMWSIQWAEHSAVVELHPLVQLDHRELVPARLGAPVFVLRSRTQASSEITWSPPAFPFQMSRHHVNCSVRFLTSSMFLL